MRVAVIPPVRPLNPIPRSLLQDEKFQKYQWITAHIAKDPSDPRPESFKVKAGSIELMEVVPTDDRGWLTRVQLTFKNPSWQFQSVEELFQNERENGSSIGVVTPREIKSVSILDRSGEESMFEDKLKAIRARLEAENAQQVLFDEMVSSTPVEMRNLDFVRNNFAQIYAGLGDNEQALTWLDKACNERAVWIPFLKVDLKFDPLRSNPRFQELLKKVGFPAV